MQHFQDLTYRTIVLGTLLIVCAIIMFNNGHIQTPRLADLLALEAASSTAEGGNIFGFAQFLSSLALFVTIFNVSDFRFKFRVLVWFLDVRKFGLSAAVLISLTLIVVEFWFQNHLPIPHVINSYANIKLLIGSTFAMLVLVFVASCFVWPVRFKKANARRFFSVTNFHIHQGNDDRLQSIAEELGTAIVDIFRAASEVKSQDLRSSDLSMYAHNALLILSSRQFCRVIVDRVPGFAIRCFELASTYPSVPFADFAHHVGEEFIFNTRSVFHEEDSLGSGYPRLEKPVSKIVFGNYALVEGCASRRFSQLDIGHRRIISLDREQIEGFYMAATSFTESYLQTTRGQSHSFAFSRLIGTFESFNSSVSKLEGLSEGAYQSPFYAGIEHSMKFITFSVKLLDKLGIAPSSLREGNEDSFDAFDELANLFYDAILNATWVTRPEFTCWSIQHNLVWRGQLSFYSDTKASRALMFKVRRKLYDKIVEMDKFPNFVAARILGYCLNVFGLRETNKADSLDKYSYPLQKITLAWTKRRFRSIHAKYPNVANACLQGFISYDEKGQRLVQTSGNKIRSELFYFNLD